MKLDRFIQHDQNLVVVGVQVLLLSGKFICELTHFSTFSLPAHLTLQLGNLCQLPSLFHLKNVLCIVHAVYSPLQTLLDCLHFGYT